MNALRERIAVALSTKLVKSLRRHLQQLPRHLEARFVTAFEEEDGVRRPWTSNLKEDAARARSECAQVLAQLPLVPSGLHVPGVQEGELRMARVRPLPQADHCLLIALLSQRFGRLWHRIVCLALSHVACWWCS